MKNLNEFKTINPIRDNILKSFKFNIIKKFDKNIHKKKIENIEKNVKEKCSKYKYNRCAFLNCYISNLKRSLYYWETVEKKSRNRDRRKKARLIKYSLNGTISVFEKVKYKLCDKIKK